MHAEVILIYSVTVSIEAEFAQDWLQWMATVHVPDVLATGCFTACRIVRLAEPVVDEQFETFNLQYDCPTESHYDRYQAEHAPSLQEAHTRRYDGRFTAFRTLLQPVGLWLGTPDN